MAVAGDCAGNGPDKSGASREAVRWLVGSLDQHAAAFHRVHLKQYDQLDPIHHQEQWGIFQEL